MSDMRAPSSILPLLMLGALCLMLGALCLPLRAQTLLSPRESWDLSFLRDGYSGILHADNGAYDGHRGQLFVNGESGRVPTRVRWSSRQVERLSLPPNLPRRIKAVHPGSGRLLLSRRDQQGVPREVFSLDPVTGLSHPIPALSGARALDAAYDGTLDRLFLSTEGSAVYVMEGGEGTVTDSLMVGPGVAGIAVDSIHSRLAVARWKESDGIFAIEVYSTLSLARLFAVPIADGRRYRDVLIAPELQRMALVGERDLLVLDEFGQILYRAVFGGTVRSWDLDPRSSSALLLVSPSDPGVPADLRRLLVLSLARPEKDSLELDGSPSTLFARAETQEVLILHADRSLLRVLHVPSRTIRTSMPLGHGIDGLAFASDGSLWISDASGQGTSLSLLSPGRPYRTIALEGTPGELVSCGDSMLVALPSRTSLSVCETQPAQVVNRLDLSGFPSRAHPPWLRLAARPGWILVGDPLTGRIQVQNLFAGSSRLLFFPPSPQSRDSSLLHVTMIPSLDRGVALRAADSRVLLFSLSDPSWIEERSIDLPPDPAETFSTYLRSGPDSPTFFIGSRAWDPGTNALSAPLAPAGALFLYRDSSSVLWFLVLRDSAWSLRAVASDGTPHEVLPLSSLRVEQVAIDASRERFAVGDPRAGRVELYETSSLLHRALLGTPDSPRLQCWLGHEQRRVGIVGGSTAVRWTLVAFDLMGRRLWSREGLRTGDQLHLPLREVSGHLLLIQARGSDGTLLHAVVPIF